jgi:hypothetical protein
MDANSLRLGSRDMSLVIDTQKPPPWRRWKYTANQGLADVSFPTVLLVTACRWPSATRLALALTEAGFSVEALCPAGHSLALATFVSAVYHYRPLWPGRSLREGIIRSDPDIIIPTDDFAAAQLHRLYKSIAPNSPESSLRSLIARSLGDPRKYSEMFSRASVAALARRVKVATPEVTRIRTEEQLIRQLKAIGFPAVLKIDGSSGGLGVAIVENLHQAKQAFRRLSRSPSAALTLKRLLVDRDANLVLPAMLRIRPQVTIQPFIRGKRANIAIACWNGAVLASVCVEVLASNKPTSSSTVVRVITNTQMSRAAERIVNALKLTGLCGMDFIIDADNRAHLIDFNPRATQTAHLVSSEGRLLLNALASKLTGEPLIEEDRYPQRGPIVLFPHGFVCDPASRYSRFVAKDLPLHPEFSQFGLDYRRETNRFLPKAVHYLWGRWQALLGSN